MKIHPPTLAHGIAKGAGGRGGGHTNKFMATPRLSCLGLGALEENGSSSAIKWHHSQNIKSLLVFGSRSWNWQLFPLNLQQDVTTDAFQCSQFLVFIHFIYSIKEEVLFCKSIWEISWAIHIFKIMNSFVAKQNFT